MTYDSTNIFARILRGEIPNKTAYECQHTLAFHDIHPQAPVHVLVIPKGAYIDMADFAAHASAEEQTAFFKAVAELVKANGLQETGYRAIANAGVNGGQEVPHFHLHILGGTKLGRMLPKD